MSIDQTTNVDLLAQATPVHKATECDLPEDDTDAEVLRIVPPAFAVDSESSANWLVKQIVAARQYLEKVELWAEAERRRAMREEQRLLYFFGDQLRRWAEAEIAKNKGRRRSVSLPAGVVGFRAVAPKVLIVDEAIVLDWARRFCPNAVIKTERLVKTPISEFVQETGEIPQGIVIEPPRTAFFVK